MQVHLGDDYVEYFCRGRVFRLYCVGTTWVGHLPLECSFETLISKVLCDPTPKHPNIMLTWKQDNNRVDHRCSSRVNLPYRAVYSLTCERGWWRRRLAVDCINNSLEYEQRSSDDVDSDPQVYQGKETYEPLKPLTPSDSVQKRPEDDRTLEQPEGSFNDEEKDNELMMGNRPLLDTEEIELQPDEMPLNEYSELQTTAPHSIDNPSEHVAHDAYDIPSEPFGIRTVSTPSHQMPTSRNHHRQLFTTTPVSSQRRRPVKSATIESAKFCGLRPTRRDMIILGEGNRFEFQCRKNRTLRYIITCVNGTWEGDLPLTCPKDKVRNETGQSLAQARQPNKFTYNTNVNVSGCENPPKRHGMLMVRSNTFTHYYCDGGTSPSRGRHFKLKCIQGQWYGFVPERCPLTDSGRLTSESCGEPPDRSDLRRIRIYSVALYYCWSYDELITGPFYKLRCHNGTWLGKETLPDSCPHLTAKEEKPVRLVRKISPEPSRSITLPLGFTPTSTTSTALTGSSRLSQSTQAILSLTAVRPLASAERNGKGSVYVRNRTAGSRDHSEPPEAVESVVTAKERDMSILHSPPLSQLIRSSISPTKITASTRINVKALLSTTTPLTPLTSKSEYEFARDEVTTTQRFASNRNVTKSSNNSFRARSSRFTELTIPSQLSATTLLQPYPQFPIFTKTDVPIRKQHKLTGTNVDDFTEPNND